ncbi:MAG: Stp1/IreP family PP2C-type Ser/Thr phosphatase [Roseburia sp.]|nr:Stp1/IreP family PP2C-type Ser/Thr phosphatase [Roseburia sp.]
MKTFSMTDVGMRRDMNQDYMFASDTAVGKLPNLFIVADGMGGHKAGEYASRAAVETIADSISQSDSGLAVATIRKAIGEANKAILKEAIIDIEKEGMGTTIVAATLKDDKLLVANVGDSRLYIINQNEIRQVTVDHSYVEEMIRSGRIARSEARNHPDRNKITRAVGVFPKVDVDFFETKVVPGDTILLCTDGLSSMVEDDEIKRIVLGQRDIVEKTQTLIETANKNGGTDNITVMLIEPFV